MNAFALIAIPAAYFTRFSIMHRTYRPGKLKAHPVFVQILLFLFFAKVLNVIELFSQRSEFSQKKRHFIILAVNVF
jgi:hypothetical protein